LPLWRYVVLKRAILPGVLVLLVGTATGLGAFYTGDGSILESMSVRGQRFFYLDSGVYRFNPVPFAREGRVWDSVNLLVAVPLFVVAWVASTRGSLRGRLLLGGLQVYFFYVYLGSVMMYALNRLFLVYVAIVALSSVTFIQSMMGVRIEQIPARISARFPRWLFVTYSFLLASALVVLWTARILPIMRTGLMPEDYAGLTTLGSQALDLGILVPLSIATGVELIKKSPLGYYLCSIAMAVGLMMFISIPSWIAIPLIQDGKTNVFEAAPFFVLSIVGIALAITCYFAVQREEAHAISR
jgi:hypothetical protein